MPKHLKYDPDTEFQHWEMDISFDEDKRFGRRISMFGGRKPLAPMCEKCGALVVNAKLHAKWHTEEERGLA